VKAHRHYPYRPIGGASRVDSPAAAEGSVLVDQPSPLASAEPTSEIRLGPSRAGSAGSRQDTNLVLGHESIGRVQEAPLHRGFAAG